MKNKYIFVAVMLSAILAICIGVTNIYVSQREKEGKDEFVVVTSFYPMYIAASNVIGDTEGVVLKNLSEPQTGCLHDFQLTPKDMKLLSTADVFIINGGGIESFVEKIAKQYPDLQIVDASEGIELLCMSEVSHGDEHSEEHTHLHEENAHVWMNVAKHRKQVEHIAAGLANAQQKHAEVFLSNADKYDKELEKIQKSYEELASKVQGEEVILLHSAFAYVAEELGVETTYCMDLDEERQVSAGEIAEVVNAVQQHEIQVIFAEEQYASDMCKMLQNEVDVTVIYLNPLNRGEYKADSYVKGMNENLELLREVFEK